MNVNLIDGYVVYVYVLPNSCLLLLLINHNTNPKPNDESIRFTRDYLSNVYACILIL